ncbi:MAG: hypothetical protein L0271_08870 [Gemmatimonadetes bacterium]|nr:hypothetical protein [Gemmatimonadota bacterium]
MRPLLWMMFLLAACGDPATTDPRGYTKNILERPAPFVRGQPMSEMDRLGTPIRPDTMRIQPADSTSR